MPSYVVKCTRPMCGRYGQPQEVVCSMKQRDSITCPHCGAPVETHADQYGSIKVEREWQGMERENLGIAFAPDADVAAIKRDCPSIELRRTKVGNLKPISRSERHDRKWKTQMKAAADRYQQAREAGGSA